MIVEGDSDQLLKLVGQPCVRRPGEQTAECLVQIVERTAGAQRHHVERFQGEHPYLQGRLGRRIVRGRQHQALLALRAQLWIIAQRAGRRTQHLPADACQRLWALVARLQGHVGHPAARLAQQVQGLRQAQAQHGAPRGFAGQRAVQPMEVIGRLVRYGRQSLQFGQRIARAQAGLQVSDDAVDTVALMDLDEAAHGGLLAGQDCSVTRRAPQRVSDLAHLRADRSGSPPSSVMAIRSVLSTALRKPVRF